MLYANSSRFEKNSYSIKGRKSRIKSFLNQKITLEIKGAFGRYFNYIEGGSND